MKVSSIYERYEKVIFFDTETTGFDPEKDQIIELAAVVTGFGMGPIEYDKFVQLEHVKELPEKITDLTGITPLHLASGITERQMTQDFSEFCRPRNPGGTLLVAHNAQFDLSFMGKTMVRHMKEDDTKVVQPFTNADYLDTLTVYKDRAGFPHKLKDAITHYGLDGQVQNTHRAIDDAKALWAVFDAMAAERDDLADYINLFGYNEKYGISGPKFKKVTYAAQGYQFSMADANKTFPIRIGKVKHRNQEPEGGDADATHSK